MVEWLAGNRIRGTSTERTTTTGFNPVTAVAGGWKELDRTTLGSAGLNIDVNAFGNKRYYMILHSAFTTGSPDIRLQLGDSSALSTGNVYAGRWSENGSTPDSENNTTSSLIYDSVGSTFNHKFCVGYIANLATKEKLVINHSVDSDGTSAGVAPKRSEFAGKWVETTDPLDRLRVFGSSNFAIGDEVVVLGWDPADTHTTNFWEELASVTAVGGTETFETGTFTAKKYLWVQAWIEGDTTNNGLDFYVNSDTGTNYAQRYSDNGGVDGAPTSTNQMFYGGGNSTTEKFFMNAFIINNSANEKLGIANVHNLITAGAGAAPTRRENVGKWITTGSQITKVGFKNRAATTGQNITAGSIIKVWGSD